MMTTLQADASLQASSIATVHGDKRRSIKMTWRWVATVAALVEPVQTRSQATPAIKLDVVRQRCSRRRSR